MREYEECFSLLKHIRDSWRAREIVELTSM